MFKQQKWEPDSHANLVVREVSSQDDTWRFQEVSEFLYPWADILNREFFNGELPQPVISFQRTRRTVLGHFSPGRTAYGLQYNINVNQHHLGLSQAKLLEVLTHEEIHLWQYVSGNTPKTGGNYHNKAFVEKATSIGLQVHTGGRACHIGPPGDPFVALLKAHGIDTSEPLVPKRQQDDNNRWRIQQPAGQASRNRRWACACKSVWCGGDLSAKCLNCGQLFELNRAITKYWTPHGQSYGSVGESVAALMGGEYGLSKL